ncbi:hypothetical protein [Streptomyces sp. NPDC005799]|uniref:hypothetical protein n=1 Tax=Streptomyces sp. NPDC005799 TaxID=3154678 RepID=UPI003400E194
MILSKARERYEAASTMASQVARQLALAGIAFVWLLSGGLKTTGTVSIPVRLLWAGIFLASALSLDLLQYLYKTSAWAAWTNGKEHELQGNDRKASVGDKEAGTAPDWINYPTWVLFILKMACTAYAYFLIILHLASLINVRGDWTTVGV